MKFDLTCETDAGSFAICDPGAVSEIGDGSAGSVYENEARKGNLTVYSYGGNGDMRFRLFVDEPVDAELEQRADGRVVGVLRVPTGRLVASGVEALAAPGKPEGTAIPAGNYEVTGFDVEWGDEEERAGDEAARRASPSGHAIERVVAPLLVMLIWASMITGMSLLFLLAIGKTTLREAWEWVRAYGLWYLGLWAVLIGVGKLAPVGRAVRGREAAQASYPGAVVQLRRLPDDEDITGRLGCLFGPQ